MEFIFKLSFFNNISGLRAFVNYSNSFGLQLAIQVLENRKNWRKVEYEDFRSF